MYKVSKNNKSSQVTWSDFILPVRFHLSYWSSWLQVSLSALFDKLSSANCKFISLLLFLYHCPASMSSFRALCRGRAATKGSFCSLLLRSCLWPTCLPLLLHFSAASQTRRPRRKHWTSQGVIPIKPQPRDERWRKGKISHTSASDDISATFLCYGNFQTLCS